MSLGFAAETPASTAPPEHAVWKRFQHPTGLTISYPPDWTLNELPAALQIIPPDPGRNAEGPTEAYLVMAEAAEGITSLEDPRILHFLDSRMRLLASFLKRTGPGEKTKAASEPGLLVTWEGTNMKGVAVRAEAHTAILKGFCVVFFAIGERDRLAKREKTVRTMFASLASGEGQKDSRLLGRWRLGSNSNTAGDGSRSPEGTGLLTFASGGSCTWAGRTETSGAVTGRNSASDQAHGAGTAGTSRQSDKGTWSAGNGKLFILWQDGSSGTWNYEVKGAPGNRRLLLNGDKQQPDEWVEVK